MSDPGPRVLHVLPSDEWGGTQVQIVAQVLLWGSAPGTQGVAFLQPSGPVTTRLHESGERALSVAGRGGVVGVVVRLARLLRHQRIEVVEAYGFRAGLVTRAAAVLGGRPAVVIGIRSRHFSQGEPRALRTKAVIALERLLVRTVAQYDANSAGARDFLVASGFPAERFTVIPNGMDLPVHRAHPVRTRTPTIVCVARLIPLKGHDFLLAGIAQAVRGGLELRCELIGAGPEESRLRGLVASHGLDGHVEFLGRLGHEATRDRLFDADLSVLTSSYEGMPGSVLEAMAAGLPVVATDVNGTQEVVEHDVTGLLVSPGDVDALADALGRVLGDAGLRGRMGEAARARVASHYSFAQLISAKAELYREVVERRAAKRARSAVRG